jgi:hypothetical protein
MAALDASAGIIPPSTLVRTSLEARPAIIRARGERANHCFIEFFTAIMVDKACGDLRTRWRSGAPSCFMALYRMSRALLPCCGRAKPRGV